MFILTASQLDNPEMGDTPATSIELDRVEEGHGHQP